MFLMYIINGNTKEETGIVLNAVNKKQSSQDSFVGFFLTFCSKLLILKLTMAASIIYLININKRTFTKQDHDEVIKE